MFYVHGGKLTFKISENADQYAWCADGLPTKSPEKHDFFRVFLDNGMEREIAVFSKNQRGTVSGKDDDIVISYTSLTDEFGRSYDINLNIHMKTVGDTMEYYAEVENHSTVNVNEVECPFIQLEVIADEEPKNDMLYMPFGLGLKFPDPMKWVKNSHTEYVTADYEHVWTNLQYPFPLNMAWYGIESNGHIFYIGRHDEDFRTVTMSLGGAPRKAKKDEIVFNIAHYPVVQPGEKVVCGKGVVSLLEGNWKRGADIYRAWADATWYKPAKPIEWIKNSPGWQRVILKHQFGRIYFKYADLVKIYENGKKVGLDTVLVFGWWKGRFDNGYPLYEPDDDLGGAEELKRAIKTIQDMGGHVILYNNGVLIDVMGEFYENVGHKISKKNLDGAEYNEYYQFGDYGTMLRVGGYKTFTSACHATDEWKDKLVENANIKLSFNPDGLFYDQMGGHDPKLCFDKSHKHGNRVDMDAYYKRQNIDAIRAVLPEGKGVGTENGVDCFSQKFDFIHGLLNADWDNANFSALYRYTFPETIISNRFLHDERDDFKEQLNFAFTIGLRYDVSIYRGRVMDISGQPEYGKHLKYLLDLKEQYKEFFYDGTYRGPYDDMEKSDKLITSLYESKAGGKLLVIWNPEKEDEKFVVSGESYTIAPNDLKLIEL